LYTYILKVNPFCFEDAGLQGYGAKMGKSGTFAWVKEREQATEVPCVEDIGFFAGC
jgi:hypothetical protein